MQVLRPRNTVCLWDLTWTLIRTDFKTRYHGTMGGYLWALAKPLSMFVVLLLVFSFIFSMDPNYPINLVIGLFLWDFFSEGTKSGLGSLHAKGFLLTRARFPGWIVVVTSVANAAITLMIFVIIMIAYLGLFRHGLSFLHVALFFSYLLAYIMIVIGFSLAASVLFMRYRDLNQVWELVLQAGFFVAPVIYPLNIIPEWTHFFLYLWLPTPVIQFSRAVLVDHQIPTLRAHGMLLASAVAVLSIGVVIYRWLAPRAIEEL